MTGSNWIERAKRITGLDGAVAFTMSARLCQIVSSTGTVLLIIRFLSPVEQGYYYTLLSLAALQVVFELGFSFVILQLAAHESVHLIIHADGRVEGDAVARERLASVLQLTVRWYLRAAIALAAILLPSGIVFFSNGRHSGAPVPWLGPWVATVFAVSASFMLTPLYSFIEGCNQVRQVARVRLYQAAVVLLASWAAIATHHGLYACALVNVGAIIVGACFLARRRRFLLGLLYYPALESAVSWRKEIWPFQWKIAVSWLCSYFTMQIFTPILFAFRGPQEAGRMGLSLSIAGYLPIVALCWITTKAAPFGQLVKLGRLEELNTLFFRSFRQSMLLILILATACFAAVVSVQKVLPGIAARMEGPLSSALLLLTAVSSFAIQSMAVYLRSFKREPFLLPSTVVAGFTLAAVLITVPRWGSAAVALVYFATTGVISLLWAAAIFHSRTSGRHRRIGATPVDPIYIPEMAGTVAIALPHALTEGRTE